MEISFSPNPDRPALVIGGAGVDIVGRLRSELRSRTSNPALFRTSFGGVARNVAENLARMGQAVTLITAVGADQTGEQLLEQTAEPGVDVSQVMRTDAYPTGMYVGVVEKSGALQIALDDMRVISTLNSAYLRDRAALFEQASLVFVDANLPKETLRTVVSLTRRAGLPLCADPTSTTLADRLRPYLSRLKLISPNSAEAAVLMDQPFDATKSSQAIQAAKYLVGQGVEICVITMAEFGVVYATSETSGRVPAVRTEILDPTGAGDALTATLLYALLNEIPLDDAVALGASAATLTLRHPGSVLPDLTLEMLYDHLVI